VEIIEEDSSEEEGDEVQEKDLVIYLKELSIMVTPEKSEVHEPFLPQKTFTDLEILEKALLRTVDDKSEA